MTSDQWMWLGAFWGAVIWIYLLKKACDMDKKHEEIRKEKDHEFWKERWDETDD